MSRCPLAQRQAVVACLRPVLALLAVVVLSGAARAATFTVDRTDDAAVSTCGVAANDCTLRGAITKANSITSVDTIGFDATVFASPQTIALPIALPHLTDDVTIIASAGKVNVQEADPNPNYIDGIFWVDASVSATLSGLTINGGVFGLMSQGTLTATNCTVSGSGVGINNYGTELVTVINCTVSGNDTGINNLSTLSEFDGSTVIATNCTFSGNTNEGISNGPLSVVIATNCTLSGSATGIANHAGSVQATNCTVSGNGTGIYHTDSHVGSSDPGAVTLKNTLVVGNSTNVDGAFIDGGYNITSGTAAAAGLQVDGSGKPVLANNGGPTPTIALRPGSVAIDQGGPGGPAADQRGLTRPVDFPTIANPAQGAPGGGDGSDIGAFEVQDSAQSGPAFEVNTLSDHNDGACSAADCTLREAIGAANAQAGANAITFSANVRGAITLQVALGHLNLTDSITITGPGARLLAVSGSTLSRVFAFSGGASAVSGLTIRDGAASNLPTVAAAGAGVYNQATLTLADCTLSGNQVRGGLNTSLAAPGGIGQGGAIYNSGTLRLNHCTFSGNAASGGRGGDGGTVAGDNQLGGTGGDARGGAVFNATGATLTVANCTFSGNSATGGASGNGYLGGHGGDARGGAVFNESGATLTMTNCTLGGNSATGGAGGNGHFGGHGGAASGGLFNLGTFTATAATCSGNTGTGGAGGAGSNSFNGGAPGPGSGGLAAGGGASTVRNTISAGNTGGTGGGSDVDGAFTSQGYNLIGSADHSTGFTATGDQTGSAAAPLDAELGALQNNGGPTDTMALLDGSPALDKGKAFGLSTDQRGRLRPFNNPASAPAPGGDGSDIGAFEWQAPALSINDLTVTEGNSGSLNAVFTVRLLDGPNASVSVHYATANGTASAGSDYTASSGNLSFSPGDTSKTLSVPIVGDTLDEANETFKVNLSSAVNAAIMDGLGIGTIQDNDPTPHFIISDVTMTEGDNSQVAATFHLTLSAVSGRPVTVTYKTADGTAQAGADYVARPSTTLTFNPSQTSKTITVLVKGDAIDEGNETFKVVLQSATNAALPDLKGVGTITDNDPLPTLRIADAPAANEGDLGTHAVLFKVTLSGATERTVTVNYATGVGTATAGSDYNATTGTLTFQPGQTSKNVAVQVLGDTKVEPDETVKVNLSGATFATIADSQGLHPILDDDASE